MRSFGLCSGFGWLALSLILACNSGTGEPGGEQATETDAGDGEPGDGDGDGEPGDGDGEPGDGDGEPGDGDGDGEPGDGDGEPGDGDGDGEPGDGDGEPGDGDGDSQTCEDVAQAYDALAGTVECQTDDECQVVFGHCHIGLGDCWYVVNDSVTQAELDGLAQEFEGLGCFGPVCLCIPPPDALACVDNVCQGA